MLEFILLWDWIVFFIIFVVLLIQFIKMHKIFKEFKTQRLEYAFLCEMQRKVDLYFRNAPDEVIEKDLKEVQKKLKKLDSEL